MRKTAVVTGGATGIGRKTVIKLCEDGYFTFIFCNKSDKEAEKLCNELNKEKHCAVYIKADLSDPQSVKNAMTEVFNLSGSIDVLVNNAGISQQKLFCDISLDDWHSMMNVNLNSVFYMCREIVPSMIKNQKGKIINISSMWGICGASCEVHYSASKAAVIGFTKALAQELGPSGINVNCIAPGVIDTKMNAKFSEEDKALMCEEIPLGRLGAGEDVAKAVLFLEENEYVTGIDLPVNGGFSIM